MTTTHRDVREGYRGYGVRVRPSLGARTPLVGPIPEIVADSGIYAGTRMFDLEQEKGLAMMRSLSAAQ